MAGYGSPWAKPLGRLTERIPDAEAPEPMSSAPVMPSAPAFAAPAPMAPPTAGPMAAPSFAPPAYAPPRQGTGQQLAQLIPALLIGLKDPGAMGAALRGLQKGRDRKLAQYEDEFARTERKSREAAEFYARAMQQANQIEDAADFERWRQMIGPSAELLGINPALFTFNASKAEQKKMNTLVARLEAMEKRDPSLVQRDDFSVSTPEYGDVRVSIIRSWSQAKDDKTGKRIVPSTDKPFAATTPDEMKIASHARALGKKPEDLTPEEIQAAVGAGKTTSAEAPPTPGSIEDYMAASPERRAEIVAAKKALGQADDRPITVNTGAADSRMNTRIDRIVTAFNSHPIVKEYNETQAQQGIVQSVVNGAWSGPGDMATVFAFMKALDPNSVVRETEYANAARSGNIFMGWAARFNGAVSPNGGFLSEQVKRDFLATINARMAVKTKQYQNLRTQLSGRIDRIKAGAPETGDEALVEYATGSTATAPPVPTQRFNPATGKLEPIR